MQGTWNIQRDREREREREVELEEEYVRVREKYGIFYRDNRKNITVVRTPSLCPLVLPLKVWRQVWEVNEVI
jgi:hypothetical protein